MTKKRSIKQVLRMKETSIIIRRRMVNEERITRERMENEVEKRGEKNQLFIFIEGPVCGFFFFFFS